MYTLFAWLFVGAAGVFVIWYYRGFGGITDKLPIQSSPPARDGLAAKVTGKKQKAKRKPILLAGSKLDNTSIASSSGEVMVSKKRKIAQPQANGNVAVSTGAGRKEPISRDENSIMSNKEFALQFSRTQTGAKMEPTSKLGTSKKERRFNKAGAQDQHSGLVPESRELLAETSSTGRDADDDATDVTESPQLNGRSTAPTSGITDIDDMLEPVAEGPRVLRLTNTEGLSTSQKSRASTRPFEAVKTKKQRNAEQKRERQKEINLQSAEEHRLKGLQQMRTARLAEGTSAQTRANAFKPVAGNVWSQKSHDSQSSIRQSPLINNLPQTLDTFEPEHSIRDQSNDVNEKHPGPNITDQQSISYNSAVKNQGTNTENMQNSRPESASQVTSVPAQNLKHFSNERSEIRHNLPEDDYMEQANDEEDVWTTVSTKKDKRKTGRKDGDTGSETSNSAPRPTLQAKKLVVNGTNGNQKKQTGINRFQSIEAPEIAQGSMQNDEWAA